MASFSYATALHAWFTASRLAEDRAYCEDSASTEKMTWTAPFTAYGAGWSH